MSHHTGIAIQTRFEVNGTAARFHVQADDRSGMYPDWEQELIGQTTPIPGSNRSETQLSGFGPATITLALWFDDRDAYRVFRSLYGATGTLHLVAAFTSQDGPLTHIGGMDYEAFENVTLRAVSQPRHRVGGTVECQAAFIRGYDPVTNTGVV